MPLSKILIANRGEIAVRIARAASAQGIITIGVYAPDDAASGHVQSVDTAVQLTTEGPAGYLAADELIAIAIKHECDGIHPGYGFLSERASFAMAAINAGLVFIGPTVDALTIFGDKERARALAVLADVPVLAGTGKSVSLDEAIRFMQSFGEGGAVMIKAVAGGGGRGIRVVSAPSELESSLTRASSEASKAFGDGSLYLEQYLVGARHIEVQIVGDGTGAIAILGERECSVQRRHQKLVEVAPAPNLSDSLRTCLFDAARRLGTAAKYLGVGTVEFLVDATHNQFFFIEANARLQVEHTVTEMVTGLDLVSMQFSIADGKTLKELDLEADAFVATTGFAIQTRICAERVNSAGVAEPTSGVVSAFDLPIGDGLRVDTHAYVGYEASPRYDSLLAKLIVHHGSDRFADCVEKAKNAVAALNIAGLETNVAALQRVLSEAEFVSGTYTTQLFDIRAAALSSGPAAAATVGVSVDTNDPLAVLDLGRSSAQSNQARTGESASTGVPATSHFSNESDVLAPMQGTIIAVEVAEGDLIAKGSVIVVMEAMKMEHEVRARTTGLITKLHARIGTTVASGFVLATLNPAEEHALVEEVGQDVDLDHIRPDLAEVLERLAIGSDERRPKAVEKRRRTGQRTARENINDLCDSESFREFGAVVVAAQRRRRSEEELIEQTPADGLVGGIGTINADQFGETDARCVIATYDYTVLAGTQGNQNHRKKDRLFELAEKWRMPVVLFAEGGGGRPGDTDGLGVTGLDCLAFHIFGRLSGQVPLVGITSGYCFAGNAALLGCCDVIIATKGSNIGMGGPAMIEGGGLGVFHPTEIGPLSDQVPNGVVDIVVEDEAEAVAVAKKYLAYFQGATKNWSCADQRRLRNAIPENRLRAYDIRSLINDLADEDSVMELRPNFGVGMVTAFARFEGRPVGIIANNPTHLGGAIDSDACDKACRFMQLCDSYNIALVFLCDTPGFMVGPEAEQSALVRKAGRMFVTSASVSVPFCTIVLRKGYGLGAQAMAGGGFKIPIFTVAWPTGEFGGMGLEGAVKLGYRNELAAIEDPLARRASFDEMVARMYERGKALSVASHFEIDAVIDPAESRRWIMQAISMIGTREPGKRPIVDTW